MDLRSSVIAVAVSSLTWSLSVLPAAAAVFVLNNSDPTTLSNLFGSSLVTIDDLGTIPGEGVDALYATTGDGVEFLPYGSPSRQIVGTTWTNWQGGYTGPVYTNGNTLTFDLINGTTSTPGGVTAFQFYVGSADTVGSDLFTAMATYTGGGTTSLAQSFNGGPNAANYFGFYTTGTDTLSAITISSNTNFAIGQMSISTATPVPFEPSPTWALGLLGVHQLYSRWRKRQRSLVLSAAPTLEKTPSHL